MCCLCALQNGLYGTNCGPPTARSALTDFAKATPFPTPPPPFGYVAGASSCLWHATRMLVACAFGLLGCWSPPRLGYEPDRFRSKPFDWGRLNASRGFCGMTKCYFPARLSEREVAGEWLGCS